jgi:HAE1 family hydrophobic/amphiphilic exporter-1
MMRRASFALATALLAAAPLAADPLSRAEAVRLALEANPDVKKAEENMNRLHGFVTEARADALPEIRAYGQWSRFRDPSFLNSPSFDNFPPEFLEGLKPVPASLWDGYATLKQTLWSFKIGRAIKAAKLATQSGDEEIRRVQQAVALLAVQAYNDYVLGIERVRVAKQAVTQKEKQLETTRNRRAAGVATDLDVLRFEVDFENARVQQLSEEGQADLARGRLNAVLVRPIGSPVEPTNRLEYMAMDISPEEAVAEAWSRRPEVKQVDLEERIRDYAVGIAKAESQPSLDFNGSFGWSTRKTSDFFTNDFQKWSAGVVLTVPVFDGLRTAGKVAQARAERNMVAQTKIALENQIRLEAKDAVDRLSVAKRVLQATELNVKQSQKALEMVEANYKFGAATLLDVIDAQAAQTVADSNRNQALYVHANARAKLRFVMARDPLDPPLGASEPRLEASSHDAGTHP